MAKNLGINIKIGADLKKFSSDMQNVQRQMRRTGKKMKSIGTSMTRSLTLPLALIGGASVKLAIDFEQSMAKVKAISGATGEQFKMLEKNALDLGRTTRYTSAQVAELQLNLSKLGFSPEEIEASTAAILDLALATGEDLAQSATVTAATMKGFDLQASESGRVADVMAASFSGSALDLEKFGTAMATVAPIAKLAGASLEETSAILGVLTDRGMDASTAGTSLRNIYLRLSQQGLTWAEAMEKVKNAQVPLNAATEIFGVKAAAASAIIANNKEQLSKMTQELNNSEGAARAMAAIMDKTLNGAVLRAKSALEGMGLEIGKILGPMIGAITNKIIELSNWFSGLSDTTKKTIVVVAALVAAIGPLLIAMGSLTLLIPSIKTALEAMTGPVGLVVMGLTAIAAIIIANWSKIAPKIQEVTDYFTELYNESYAVRHAVQSIVLVFKILYRVAKNSVLNIWEVFKGFGGLIADLFGGMGKLIKGVFTLSFDDVKEGVKQLGGAIKGNMTDVLNGITDNAEDMMEDMKGDFADFNDALNKKVKPVVIPIKLGGEKKKSDTDDTTTSNGGGVIGDPYTKELINMKPIGMSKDTLDEVSLAMSSAIENQKILGSTHSEISEKMEKVNSSLSESFKVFGANTSGIWQDFKNSMSDALTEMNAMLADFVGGQLAGLFDAIGQEIAGGTKQIDDWGKNLLKSFGQFLSEMGGMVIAYGVAKMALLKNLHPAIIIGAGIAMTIAGGMIKEKTKDVGSALDGSGGGGGGGASPVTFNNDFGAGQGMLTLNTVVYGNDIVLSNNRQHNTNMRTRRK